MNHTDRLALAREAYQSKAEARHYIVTWRGGGEPVTYSGISGLSDLAAMLKVQTSTLCSYFSRFKNVHQVKRRNPTTGEDDIATITRTVPSAKQKRPVGRPPKAIDWDRMGVEAPDYAKAGFTQKPEFFPRKLAKRDTPT